MKIHKKIGKICIFGLGALSLVVLGFWRGRIYEFNEEKTFNGAPNPGRAKGRSYLGIKMGHDGRGGKEGDITERLRPFEIREIVLDPKYKQEAHIEIGSGEYLVHDPGTITGKVITETVRSIVGVYAMEDNDMPFWQEVVIGLINSHKQPLRKQGMNTRESGDSFVIKSVGDGLSKKTPYAYDVAEVNNKNNIHIYLQSDGSAVDIHYKIINKK